ncbi:MAG: hypothetical protein QM713_05885 [Arachnia sp.]
MTTWPGFSLRRAASARALLGLLLALVVVSTAIVAGTLGQSRALATRAAATALADTSVGDIGIEVQTRLGPDPAAQDETARSLLAAGFAPAPVIVDTSYLSSKGEPIEAADASNKAESFVRWTVRPDIARIQPDQLDALAGGAERARAVVKKVDVTGRGITVNGDLGETAARAAQDFAVGEAFRLVPLSVLLLVAIVGLAQVASLLATARERELHLLFARGASLRQVLAAGVAEALVVALVGALAGTGVAALVVWAISGTTAHGTPVLAGGAIGAVLAAACLSAVSARSSIQAARGETVRSDRVRAVAGAAGFVLVAVLAGIAAWQLRRAGRFLTVDDEGTVSTDAVSALAPALLIAVAAVAALLALAPLTRLLELLTRRGRSAALWLAGAHLARGLRLHAVPVALTVLATATATFASLFAGTSSAMQRDLQILTAGAPIRVTASDLDTDFPTRLSLPAVADVDGVTAAAPIWRAEAAQIGDLALPAVAAPTTDLARAAVLPQGLAVPVLTLPPPSADPRPVPIPEGTTELTVSLDARIVLDPWQQLQFDLQPQLASAGDRTGDVAREILDQAIEQYEFAGSVTVTLTVRDVTTGFATVLDGARLDLSPNTVERGQTNRFTGGTGTITGTVALPPGRALAIDAVLIDLGGGWAPATLDATIDVAAGGTSLLGAPTAAWLGDTAISYDRANDYRSEASGVTPEAHVEKSEFDDMVTYYVSTNAPFIPASVLDAGAAPWRLTASATDTSIRVGPTVTFGGAEPAVLDPLGVMAAPAAPAPEPAPVALTTRAAAEANLAVGDRIEINAFGSRIPAVVAAVLDWLPSVAGDRAMLIDSGVLGASRAAPTPVLGRPTELWVGVDGDANAVAEAVRAVPGVTAVTVSSPDTAQGPAEAAAGSLWLAAVSALALAVTGLAAAVSTQLTTRRPEVAVLRAAGMTPSAQARSRAWEVGGVLAIAGAVGLLAGWAISAVVVGPLSGSSGSIALPTSLRPDVLPLVLILAVGAAGVAAIVAWLAAAVRRQALDSEYREEVR